MFFYYLCTYYESKSMNEQLETSGTITSAKDNVEVTFISKNGLILLVGDKEYYLSYGKFPWFKTASVSDVFDVQMKGRNRIRWEALDVDLNLSIITNPDAYPLIAKKQLVRFALVRSVKIQMNLLHAGTAV